MVQKRSTIILSHHTISGILASWKSYNQENHGSYKGMRVVKACAETSCALSLRIIG